MPTMVPCSCKSVNQPILLKDMSSDINEGTITVAIKINSFNLRKCQIRIFDYVFINNFMFFLHICSKIKKNTYKNFETCFTFCSIFEFVKSV